MINVTDSTISGETGSSADEQWIDDWVEELEKALRSRPLPDPEQERAELERLVAEMGMTPKPRPPDPRMQEVLESIRNTTRARRWRESVNSAGEPSNNRVPPLTGGSREVLDDKNVPSAVAGAQPEVVGKNGPEAQSSRPDEMVRLGKNVPFGDDIAKQRKEIPPCNTRTSGPRGVPRDLPSVVRIVSDEESQEAKESSSKNEEQDGPRARLASALAGDEGAEEPAPTSRPLALGSPRWTCVRRSGSFRYYELRARDSHGRLRVLRRAFRGGGHGDDPLPPGKPPDPPPPPATTDDEAKTAKAAIELAAAATSTAPPIGKLPRWRDLNDVGTFYWWQKAIEGPCHAFTLQMSHHVRREALAHPQGFTRSFMMKLAKNLKRALNHDVQVCFAVDPQNSRKRFKPHIHGFLGIAADEVATAEKVLRRMVKRRAPMKFRDYLVDIRPAYCTANWASYCLKDYEPHDFEWLKGRPIACTSSLKKRAQKAYERYRASAVATRAAK